MSLIDVISLLIRQWKILIVVPLTMAMITYFLVKDMGKEYTSTTLIYTGLASGFNIETTGETRRDHNVINNAFDNLLNTVKSKETLREVAFRLLALHLCAVQPDTGIISQKSFVALRELLDEPTRQKLTIDDSPEKTYYNILRAYENVSPAIVRQIFHDKSTPYSLSTLSKITAIRKGTSDMIEITYKSDDGLITEKTLSILLEVFLRRYKSLKSTETNNVVAYFEKRLADARTTLRASEDELTNFRDRGKVLNYYEQSKAIALQKEALTDEYKRLQGEMKASENVSQELAKKLNFDGDKLSNSSDILAKRQRLSFLTSQIIQLEAGGNAEELKKVKKEALKLEEELGSNIKQLYKYSYSTDGVKTEDLLNAWLANIIDSEKNKARSEILKQRIDEVTKVYDSYSLLGSGMARLEREINIKEQAYLEILKSLNLSLLRKQNIEITTNLTVIDEPTTSVAPPKKTLLVIVAFLAGLMSCLTLIIAAEFLDMTIKTPNRANTFTKLNVAGMIPLFPRKKVLNPDWLNTFLNQMILKIKLGFDVQANYPKLILISSTQNGEGRTTTTNLLVERLRKTGSKICWISENSEIAVHQDNFSYSPNEQLIELKNIEQIIGKDLKNYDYCLMEIPPLLTGNLPINLIQQANLLLLVVRANRAWTNPDQQIVSTIQKSEVNMMLVLNGVRQIFWSSVVGEMFQNQATFKQKIKNILRFQFFAKSAIR